MDKNKMQNPLSNEPKKILSVKDLSKYFNKNGKIFKVLDELSFDIYEGDFFGVIGESGSGKSTTGKCIIRLYDTNGGIITFLDKIINNKKISKNFTRWLTKNMQMIFQDPMSSLNPRKNVLSLISEPIKINGSLIKEVKEILNICRNINYYFPKLFVWQDYNLNQQYLLPYLINVIKFFQETIKALDTIEIKDSIETLNDDILTIFNTLEVNFTKELKNIFTLLNATKELIFTNYQKLKNAHVDPVEIEYVDAKNKLIADEQIYKHSAKWIELKKQSDELKAQRKNLENEINNKYKEQNTVFISSLIADYKNQVDLYKQKKDTTKDLFYYSLNKIKVAIAEDIIKIFEKTKNDIYLSIDEIKEFSSFIDEKVSNKYKFLLEQIAILSNIDEHVNETLFMALDDNNKKLPLTPELKEWFNSYKEINSLIDAKINEDFLSTSKSIKKAVYNLHKKSKNTKNFLFNEIKKRSSEITKIDVELTRLSILYKQSNVRHKNYLQYEKTKEIYKEKSFKRQHYLDLDTEYFNNHCYPLIVAQNNDIKCLLLQLKQEYKYLKKKINKMIKTVKHSSLKNIDDDFKNNFDKLKTEIKNRINNLIALNLQHNSIIEQINLYKNLRTKNTINLYLNQPYLKKVITFEKVFNALNDVGLKHEHAFRYPHEFSGGQRQRIVIARSLISQPKFIIADEPISALDVSIQAQVVNIMKKLSENQGITFMFIAHDLSMVNFLCNRLIILHKGKIVEKGNTNEIFKNPIHPYTISLIKSSPELSKIHVDLSSFDNDINYDKNYSIHNKPQFYKVPNETDHHVFCSEEQFKKWVK